MAALNSQIGFDCAFVEDPPKCLQIVCPICLHILREPYQVTCCGKSFCRQCIEMVKDNNHPCPCCKQDNFNDFPNKGLQQPLYGFQVLCSNKEKGCHWKGELGQLDNHLNLNLSNDTCDNHFEGCEFAEIKCEYCSDVLVRNNLLHHKTELCDKRPFSCEYCNEYESTYDDVIHYHWPICGNHPVRCPNECGAFPQRQNLKNHLQKDCPLTVMECKFHYAGCEIRLPRKNMPDHLKDDLTTHVLLLAVSHKQQQDEVKALNKKYQEEIQALSKKYQEETEILKKRHQDEIKALSEEMNELKIQTQQLRLHMQIVPVEFLVENPRIGWSSTLFYSHSQGYKLRLRFCYSSGLGTYTLSCLLIPGEFDSFLKWPLKAVMKVMLCQQLPGEPGHEFSIQLNHKHRLADGFDQCGSVFLGIVDPSPYLHKNCLQMRIISVQFLE